MQTHVNAPKFAMHSVVGSTASLTEIFWLAVALTLSLKAEQDAQCTASQHSNHDEKSPPLSLSNTSTRNALWVQFRVRTIEKTHAS